MYLVLPALISSPTSLVAATKLMRYPLESVYFLEYINIIGINQKLMFTI